MADDVTQTFRPEAVPSATVSRLPHYLRTLRELMAGDVDTVSSSELASLAGVSSAQLRKDLSFLGSYGTRGVGYSVDTLVAHIASALGLTDEHRIAIVGLGHLGHALANYSGFPARGFQTVALLDAAPDVVGSRVAGLEVEHIDTLATVVRREDVSMVVLTAPARYAQDIADLVVAAGVREILNFAPVALRVPRDVVVRGVDVGGELQILAFHAQARAHKAPGSGRTDRPAGGSDSGSSRPAGSV